MDLKTAKMYYSSCPLCGHKCYVKQDKIMCDFCKWEYKYQKEEDSGDEKNEC